MRACQARSAAIGLVCAGLALSGCAQSTPTARPTIGSPSAPATATAIREVRADFLAQAWDLTGSPLPNDWPNVPLPRGTEVVSAYAIGTEPRRTWTATFTATSGSALDLATPVVRELRERQYVPIARYVGAEETNTGLFSFAAPTFAIYVVLGEDQGQPNVVITVRGSTDESAGLPAAQSEPAVDPRLEFPQPTAAPTALAPDPTPDPGATATP